MGSNNPNWVQNMDILEKWANMQANRKKEIRRKKTIPVSAKIVLDLTNSLLECGRVCVTDNYDYFTECSKNNKI